VLPWLRFGVVDSSFDVEEKLLLFIDIVLLLGSCGELSLGQA
jgi:hypothetical protein